MPERAKQLVLLREKRISCVSRGGAASSCPHLCMRTDRGPCGDDPTFHAGDARVLCTVCPYCRVSSSGTGKHASVPLWWLAEKQEPAPSIAAAGGCHVDAFHFSLFSTLHHCRHRLSDQDLKPAGRPQAAMHEQGGNPVKTLAALDSGGQGNCGVAEQSGSDLTHHNLGLTVRRRPSRTANGSGPIPAPCH